MARVCADACFLIGLYDQNDEHHQRAAEQFEFLFGEDARPVRNILVAPWPILYESFGSRQARNFNKTKELQRHWEYLQRFEQLELVDDSPYRVASLQDHLEEVRRPMSLVDRVLRAMILDANRPFDYFLTYNTGDFADACQSSGVSLINQGTFMSSYGI